MDGRWGSRALLPTLAAAGLLGGVVVSCTGSGGDDCEGAEGCGCYGNGSCDDGLVCLSKLCVDAADERNESQDSPSEGEATESDEAASGTETDASSTDASETDPGGTDSTDEPSAGGQDESTDAADGAGAATTDITMTDDVMIDGTDGEATTDSSGQPVAEPDLRLSVVSADGWVDGSSNDVGIQGDWHTYGDTVSTFAPRSEPFFSGGSVCLSGLIPPYADEPDVWGAGLSLNLNVTAPGQPPGAWDATEHDVRGFSFTLAGENPPLVQVNYPVVGQADGTIYCFEERDVDPNTHASSVDFEQTRYNCWDGDDGPNPDETNLRAFQVQVLPHDTEYVEFDFCLEDVAAVQRVQE